MEEMSGLSRAEAGVRDVGSRTVTRVFTVYGLTGDLPEDGPRSLGEVWELGRFARNVEAAAFLLPRPVVSVELDDGDLKLHDDVSLGLTGVRIVLLRTPRSDLALVVDAIADGAGSEEVAWLLAATCFDRYELRVRGERILDWLQRKAGAPDRLEFGRDVHQCVFPGGALLEEIRRGGSYWHILYRVTDRRASEERKIFQPAALNYSGVTVVGHSRAVALLAGWAEAAENIFGLIMITLTTALGVLHRARRNAFLAMARGGQADLASTAEARALVAEMSAQLSELQLDLSFGVEAYLDTLLMPEIVAGSFQRSLCEVNEVVEGLEHTSRMLQRLDSVIELRRSALESALQEQRERRDRVVSAIVAVGSLIAVPPAILLAFFGVNATQVDSGRSIFDLHRYWGAYMLAWLPYVLLVAIGFVLQRRIRGRTAMARRSDEALPHDPRRAG
jgi:hypothetical protein